MKRNVLIALTVILFFGCKPSENIVYEDFEKVNAKAWNWKEGKKFEFEIVEDQHVYSLFSSLRITSAYKYSNIWILYTLKGPNNYVKKDQIQLILSDDIGKWRGQGVSNLISFREPFLLNQKLPKGKYSIEFWQNMRDENPSEINNIGLQVLKGQLIL
jgi:gliding motility-associated lipoprotein GldH